MTEPREAVKTDSCCQIATRNHGAASRWQQAGEIMRWFGPSATLVLLPKCPACVVAYVALFSGVGISVANASYLRASLLALSVAALIWLAWKRLHRYAARQIPVGKIQRFRFSGFGKFSSRKSFLPATAGQAWQPLVSLVE